jgi:hypothetical protein
MQDQVLRDPRDIRASALSNVHPVQNDDLVVADSRYTNRHIEADRCGVAYA